MKIVELGPKDWSRGEGPDCAAGCRFPKLKQRDGCADCWEQRDVLAKDGKSQGERSAHSFVIKVVQGVMKDSNR